jgi:hypothetical protein
MIRLMANSPIIFDTYLHFNEAFEHTFRSTWRWHRDQLSRGENERHAMLAGARP